MSKFYTVSLQNETIIFTAAFEKKLNNGNKEAYDLYIETKKQLQPKGRIKFMWSFLLSKAIQ